MPYKPDADLNDIRGVIASNPEILAEMGLADADTEVVNDAIIKTNRYYDLAEGQKRLCLFSRPSRAGGMDITSEMLLDVLCHVPNIAPDSARKIVGLVWESVGKKQINGKILHWGGELGELPTAPGFYCYGLRLTYIRVVY